MRLAMLALSAMLLVAPAAAKDDALPSAVVRIVMERGHGTGFYVGDGLVVTAAHVVDGEKGVTVRLEDGRTTSTNLLFFSRRDDIAVLEVDLRDTPQIARVNCKAPAVGDSISTYGNPIGLEFVRAWGRVSGRTRAVEDWRATWIAHMTVLPGNSGGPVFAEDGRVVGVVSAVALFLGVPTEYALILPSASVCRALSVVRNPA